jgi:hypothetical protein
VELSMPASAFATQWPNITRKGEPPPDADEWKDKPGKARKSCSRVNRARDLI